MSASPSTKVDHNNYPTHHVYFLNTSLLTLWYRSLDPDPPYTVFTRLAGCHLSFVLSCFMMPLPIPSSSSTPLLFTHLTHCLRREREFALKPVMNADHLGTQNSVKPIFILQCFKSLMKICGATEQSHKSGRVLNTYMETVCR